MHTTSRAVTLVGATILLGAPAILGACGSSEPPLDGTFAGTAVTPLPSPPLPEADLTIDATLDLDAATSRFRLDMDLEAAGLTDVMHVRGSYLTANGMLTLRPDAIEPEPGTGSEVSTGADGAPCIALAGFAGTIVCMPEGTSAFTLAGSQLSFTLAERIADVPGTVAMTLTRVVP